jgi:hypothetical protein
VSQPTTSSGGQPVTVTVNNNESGCGCGCGGSGGGTGTQPPPGNPGSGGPSNPGGGKPGKGTEPPGTSTPKEPIGGCLPLAAPFYTGYGQDGIEFLKQDGLKTAIINAATTANMYDPANEVIVTATINIKAYSYSSLNASINDVVISKEMRNLLIDDGSEAVPTFGADKWGRTRGYPVYFEDKSGPFKVINVALPTDPPTEVSFSSGNFRTYDDTLSLNMNPTGPVRMTIDGQLGAPRKLPGGIFGPHNPPIAGDPSYIQITLCKINVLKNGQGGAPVDPEVPGKKDGPPIKLPPPPGPGDKEVDTGCIEMYNLDYGSGDTILTDFNLSAAARTAAMSADAGVDKLKSSEVLKSIKFTLKGASFVGSNGITLHEDEYVKVTGADNVMVPFPGSHTNGFVATLIPPFSTQMLYHVWAEQCSMEVKTTPAIRLNAKLYGFDHAVFPIIGAATKDHPAWLKICLNSFVKGAGDCTTPVELWADRLNETECWTTIGPTTPTVSWTGGQRTGIKAGALSTFVTNPFVHAKIMIPIRGDFNIGLTRDDTSQLLVNWNFYDAGVGGVENVIGGSGTIHTDNLLGTTVDTLCTLTVQYRPSSTSQQAPAVVSGWYLHDVDDPTWGA